MLDLQGLNAQDLQSLSPSSLAEVAAQMLTRIGEQTKFIASQAQAIKFKDVKIERITFELSRLKASRFGAETERLDAEQRQMFEEALAEDQASLEAQLLALQGERGQTAAPPPDEKTKSKPRRAVLPDHLRRVEYRRAGEHHLRVRPGDGAHRRGHHRKARHRAGRVLRAPPRPRQMGLQVLPGTGAAAGGAAGDRQGHAG